MVTKIVAVGLNYRAHAEEMGKALPEAPLLFLKPPSAVITSGQAIVRPRAASQVDFEGEVAVVIGRRARRVTREKALDYVAGFTCLNDVTARDLQVRDVQYTRAKGFDTFCPMGPRVVAGLDPGQIALETRVNGKVRQRTTTADLIFDVPRLIAFVSAVMTLEEGDVISTGTPSGVGPLVAGDVVEVEAEGIGVLSNPVVDDEDEEIDP